MFCWNFKNNFCLAIALISLLFSVNSVAASENVSSNSIKIEHDYKSFVKIATFNIHDHNSLNDLRNWVKLKSPTFIVHYNLHDKKSLLNSIEDFAHIHHIPLKVIHIKEPKASNTEVYYVTGKKCEYPSLNCSIYSNQLYMMDGAQQLMENHTEVVHHSYLF